MEKESDGIADVFVHADLGGKSPSNTFSLNLPNGCPPPEAVDAPNCSAYRLVKNDPVSGKDFLTLYEEEGAVRPNVCPCIFRGISLWDKIDSAKGLRKLPRMRKKFKEYKYVAEIQINNDSGKALLNSNGHICLWNYDSYDFCTHVVKVERA